jgi:hypothetical protein
MRIIALVAIMAIIINCRKDIEPPPSPTDASRIAGEWLAMIPENPEWQYSFRDGFLTQKIEDFGIPVTTQQYVYATKADTVFISGAGGQRKWVVYFECDEIVQIRDIEAQLAAVKWLKRRE